MKSSKQKQLDFGKTHNWVKKSIFWELPYWSTNMVRHNLDVMHVEKNVFDNIFNTMMDIKAKTKDTANARQDYGQQKNGKKSLLQVRAIGLPSLMP